MADSPSTSSSSSSASEQTTSSSPSSNTDAPYRTSSSPVTTPDSAAPYGSLVTPFTAPAYCSRAVRNCDSESTNCAWWMRDRTCGSDGKATVASECFPPGTHWIGPYLTSYSAILYSPAAQCPGGWVDVGRSTFSDPSTYTKVACCPS